MGTAGRSHPVVHPIVAADTTAVFHRKEDQARTACWSPIAQLVMHWRLETGKCFESADNVPAYELER